MHADGLPSNSILQKAVLNYINQKVRRQLSLQMAKVGKSKARCAEIGRGAGVAQLPLGATTLTPYGCLLNRTTLPSSHV